MIVHIADKGTFWLGLARIAMRAEAFVISSILVEVCTDPARSVVVEAIARRW
ncbi:hypothetical protein [Sorangium sp. So ce513]|uniref:hypothetical protein n=1 Tax=Sorangium sp. So ce513 TaxID=3133315 RepID=UPI003F637D13